jgi:hypothetical protein
VPAHAVVSPGPDRPETGKDPEACPAGVRDTRPMPSDGSSGPASLDFWLGEWTCTWDGGRGRNAITKELGGRVVVERFESLAPERWSGMSLSVFDERNGWRQTWVDSTGNYWAFRGSAHSEGFSFSVTEVEEGREVEKRMVFAGIQADTFDWRWERSVDGGATWEPLWIIDYHRATEGLKGAQGGNGPGRARKR